MDPVTASIAIGATLAGGALSFTQAQQQNRAVRRSMDSAQNAAAVQAKQLAEQTALERQKRINNARATEGRIRVSATAAGTGSATFDNLAQQNDYNAAVDDMVLKRNFQLNLERVFSGSQAQQYDLASRSRNGLLSTLQGGLQGLTTGLAIAGGINALTSTATPGLTASGAVRADASGSLFGNFTGSSVGGTSPGVVVPDAGGSMFGGF